MEKIGIAKTGTPFKKILVFLYNDYKKRYD